MLQASHAFEPVQERIDAPQIGTNLRVTIVNSADNPIEGELVSISRDRMLLRCAETPVSGAPINLSFRVLSRRVCEASGRVNWSRDGEFEVTLGACNEDMERSIEELAKLPLSLRQIYLADILDPRIHIETNA